MTTTNFESLGFQPISNNTNFESLGFQENTSKKSTNIGADVINALEKIPQSLISGGETAIQGAPGAIGQFIAPPNSNSSKRFIENIISGLASGGRGIVNTPHNVTKYLADKGLLPPNSIVGNAIDPKFDYGKALGIDNPSDSDKLIQGAAQYLPAALAGGSSTLGQAAAGATFGATQSENPVEGAVLGATLPGTSKLIGKGIAKGANAIKSGSSDIAGTLFGTEASKIKMSNKILDYLNKQSSKGNALTPEQAQMYQDKVFTDESGNTIPIDIGSLTGNPLLEKTYKYLQNVPLSGASTKANQVGNELASKDVNKLETSVMQLEEQNRANEPISRQISDELSKIQNTKSENEKYISRSNDNLNSFAPKGKDLLSFGKDSLKETYNKNREQVRQAFAPIQESNLDLKSIASPNDFKNYSKNATELLQQRDALKQLFGSDSDMGSRLNSELNAASSFLGKDKDQALTDKAKETLDKRGMSYKYIGQVKDQLRKNENGAQAPMTLDSVIGRVKNLGKLEAAARSMGSNNEARLLGNLRTSLKGDVVDTLKNSGNSQLAEQWQEANTLHQDKIVPYWKDPTIRKTVIDKDFSPDPEQLAKALHKTNNQPVLSQQPKDAQNAYGFEILTKGTYDPTNISRLSSEELANNYSGLKSHVKKALQQYNPNMSEYLEQLKPRIEQNKLLDKRSNDLSKKSNAISKQEEIYKGLKKSLDDARLKQLSLKRQGTTPVNLSYVPKSVSSLISKGAGLAGMAGGALPKSLTDILTSPQLTQAYIEGSKFPKSQTMMQKALAKLNKSEGNQ